MVLYQFIRNLIPSLIPVDERSPSGVLDELGEPAGSLSLLGEDCVRLLRVESLQDHVVQVVLN